MAARTPITFEVLLRPKGSKAEPQVVGEVSVDFDFLTETVQPPPAAVPIVPSPKPAREKD
jgi:hypothetical protein